MRHSGNYHGFFVPLFDDADVGADGDADATVETGADPGAEPAAQCKQGDSEIESSTANGRPRLRLLILGGYGSFGGRLAQLLCAEQGVSLIIAGRSHAKATAFCADLPPSAQRQAIALDRECDLTQQLSALKPDILIDATGPFQEYGDDPYRVVKAAIAAGIHYLDLADGSAFVRGMGQFDDAAKEQGVAVLSGVSSFPVLTAAVVRLLARDLRRVESITAGIAPSPYAGYGRSVIRAIAGYAGKQVALRRNGKDGVGYGITETRRYTIAPPGLVPLNRTEFSLIDVPDLELLADLWPEVRDVWLGAGPVPAILHRLLRALAKAVARGWIPSLVPLTPLMFHAVNRLRWGEDRGGMFVEVKGRNARGKRETHSWHLLAEGSDGPWIPSMAIAAIVRKRLAGLVPLPGARAAAAELELGDYQPFFDARRIHWGERGQGEAEDRWLYQRLLGDAYSSLPAALKTVHGTSAESTLHGKAAITRGKGLAARLAARVIGLPRAADDLSATVTFERTPIQEQWTRDFGGQTFRSRLFEGQGRFERLLCERFGPFVFAMAPVVDGHRLRLVMRGWSVLGLPLPRALAPRGDIVESEEGGRFHFHVEITLPLFGLVVRYAGFLETEPSSEPVSTSAVAEHNLNGCE